jgi:hypothetical protein
LLLAKKLGYWRINKGEIMSADWQERGGDPIAAVPAEVLDEVRGKLKALLGK